MELVIWVVFETICVLAHLLMSMIQVADPVWGWTLSAYSQVFITLISIYIFRSYLCKEPALCSLGRKELKYCVWAAVIGVGICLGHRALLLFFLDFVEKSLRDIGGVSISNNAVFVNTLPGILHEALLGPATEQPLCSPYFKFPVCSLAFKRIGYLCFCTEWNSSVRAFLVCPVGTRLLVGVCL